MDTILAQIIASSALNWIPLAFFVVLVLGISYLHLYSHVPAERQRKIFIQLVFTVIGFRVVYAGLMSGLQYYAWTQDAMGKLLLPPTQSIMYFFQYIWTHFWFNVFIACGVGLFTYGILSVLQKKNARFFNTGEVELGTLLSLVVGWPHFVIFFPLVFVLVVMISIIRGVVLKEPFTTLGVPFIVAAIIALFITMPALAFLRLTAWNI